MAPKYQEHQSALASAAEGQRLDVLRAMCEDLPAMRAITPAMMQPLEVAFLKCMDAHVKDITTQHAAGTLKVAPTRDTQTLLAKASDSFPFAKEISSWMSSVSEIMLDVQAGSTRQEFQEKLRSTIAHVCPDTLDNLLNQINASRGLQLGSED
eukprot:2954401-Heterocapsa_arctica.AAC.1